MIAITNLRPNLKNLNRSLDAVQTWLVEIKILISVLRACAQFELVIGGLAMRFKLIKFGLRTIYQKERFGTQD